MAEEEKKKYKKGYNPKSLANLQSGMWADRKKASEAGKKSASAKRTYKTLREIAEAVGKETQEFTVKKPNGTIEKVVMTRNEMIIRNFLKECVQHPNHKNILALAKLRGEEEQRITVDGNIETNYNNIEVTPEMEAKAVALLSARHDANN